jgi:hypothetical protein
MLTTVVSKQRNLYAPAALILAFNFGLLIVNGHLNPTILKVETY